MSKKVLKGIKMVTEGQFSAETGNLYMVKQTQGGGYVQLDGKKYGDASGKQDTLVSGTNIKTVNGSSILGSGNLDTGNVFEAGTGTNSAVLKGGNNSATNTNSVAEGSETFAGQNGYKYTNTGSVTNQLTLTSVNGLAVGDVVSIVNDYKYPDCSTITAINGNTVTFDSLPFTEIVSGLSDFDDYVVYVSAKPTVGDVELGISAHAEGVGSKSQNYAAHAEGRDTKAYGEYSHAEGRETTAQYASHAEGRKTEAIGTYSHAEGFSTHSTNEATHTEGRDTIANGKFAHSEGYEYCLF